jgi:hypothetical protein
MAVKWVVELQAAQGQPGQPVSQTLPFSLELKQD